MTMRFTAKISLIAAGFLSFQALAATFSLPNYFEVMYVDREKPSMFKMSSDITLDAGRHEILVRYYQVIEKRNENYRFSSQPVIIDLEVTADDQMRLDAQQPKNIHDGEKFAAAPSFEIIRKNGDLANYTSQMLPLRPGWQMGRDYLKELVEFKQQQTAAMAAHTEIAALKTQLASTPSTPNGSKSEQSTGMTTLEKLQMWYNRADDASQKAYRFWLIDPTVEPKQPTKAFEMLKYWHQQADAVTQRAIQIWMIK
jgi:uncharacterized protein YccT (UPF0319 family)